MLQLRNDSTLRWTSWSVVAVLACVACDGTGPAEAPVQAPDPTIGPTSGPAPSACPPEAFVEELHATSFQFQHGTPQEARQRLSRARALAPEALDPQSERILAQLTDISRVADSDPAAAHTATEDVRLALSEWSCLTEPLHDRFHAKLPPIPGASPAR